jgi:mRNA deadenylase 3'-5' endonuclease subunit Ccr4
LLHTTLLICLEEVEYEQFCYPLLASRQYDGLYVKKSGDGHQDGCALFYSTAAFAMLSCSAGPLSAKPKSQPFVSTPPCASSSSAAESASSSSTAASRSDSDWSQVCIIAQFAAIVDDAVHPHHRLFVVCTHLKAKEGNELVRTKQLHALTQQLTQKLSRVRQLAQEVETSIIICGDFNDTPSSAMWQLATAGQTSPTPTTILPSPSSASPSPTLSPVPPLCHSLWLHSLYDRYHSFAQPHSAYWTTVKRRAVRVQRVIDYVLYSPHTLLPLALCSVPAGVEKDEDGWPNAVYPSDHLALVGRFALIGQKMQRVPMAVHARHKL